MLRLASLALTLVLLVASGAVAARSEQEVAAAEATVVLELVYIKHDFAKAHERLHRDLRGQLGQDDLAKLAAIAESRLGPTKKLELDSFVATPDRKQMTVFVKGVNEKGTAYHRVTLIAHEGGYRVGRLQVQGAPFPSEKNRQIFQPVAR
jgi:hypothetical protein